MNNTRFKMFLSIFLIIVILALVSVYIVTKISKSNTELLSEYIPGEEISDEQFRRTNVKLYFEEINTNSLKAENRPIDSKELLVNPYSALVNLLIEGPSDENLKSIIPEGTKVNSATISGNCVLLDLSSNFTSNITDEAIASNIVYSVVYTLTELTEVNSVKFLIDGNNNSSFDECNFSLSMPFVKK